MMRQGFSFNSEGQRDAFVLRMELVAKPRLRGRTKFYGGKLDHPILSKFGYEVEVEETAPSVPVIGSAWELLYDDLNPSDINNLITFDSSWFETVN